MLSKSRFQTLLSYTRKKDRLAHGACFVEGWRWMEEALALPEPPEIVIAAAGAARSPAEDALLARAREKAREFVEATPEQLARLTENVSAPGVAALVRWRPRAADDFARVLPASADPALVLALDEVGDPGNAGTIIRTADWFGASGVLFGPGSVEPTNPKCTRSTMGSLFHLPIGETASLPDALAQLRQAGFATVGAALDGEPLTEFRWPARSILVIGNEARGLNPATASAIERKVRIPACGRAESLNAAIAAAVLVADWRRIHPLPMR